MRYLAVATTSRYPPQNSVLSTCGWPEFWGNSSL
jgi:hypothetical protein